MLYMPPRVVDYDEAAMISAMGSGQGNKVEKNTGYHGQIGTVTSSDVRVSPNRSHD